MSGLFDNLYVAEETPQKPEEEAPAQEAAA